MSARLYVSSTFEDLKAHREAVRRMIRALDHIDIAMEYYVAGSERPLVRCLNDVKGCDLYLGIFANRYGYVPEGGEQSITEQEYRTALANEKPVLGFLLAEGASWPDEHVETGKGAEKLAQLRTDIENSHLAGYFETPGDLAAGVGAAVVRALDPGATPFDAGREQRLMKDWRTSTSLMERERARAALRNMASPRYLASIKDKLLFAQQELDVSAIAGYLDEILQMSVTSAHAMPILLEMLRGENDEARRMCIFQIGELGLRSGGDIQPGIVRALLDMEADDEALVRSELAHTLSKIVHHAELRDSVMDALNRLVQDPHERVRDRAQDALQKLGG